MLLRLIRDSLVASTAAFAVISPLLGCSVGGAASDDTAAEGDRWRVSSTTMNDVPAQAIPVSRYATANIQPVAGSGVSGAARFRVSEGQVILVVSLKGATPGEHAIHIHEFPSCADDAKAAGDHWNPTNQQHGKWGSSSFHLGDIGNIRVRPDGTATLVFKTNLWTVGGGGRSDVIGHSIIIHEHADDFSTQPSGHAGGRIACGEITEAGPR